MRTADIINALRNPRPKTDVDKLIDDEVSPLVERVVTAGRNIALLRTHLVDFAYGTYVLAARAVNQAKQLEDAAQLDAAHDRAEAIELYRVLQAAHVELDKIRFGRRPDPKIIAAIGDELTKFDRPDRYDRTND